MSNDVAICRTCNEQIDFYTKLPKPFSGIKPAYCEVCLEAAMEEAEQENNINVQVGLFSRSDIPLSYKELRSFCLDPEPHQAEALKELSKIQKIDKNTKLPYLHGPTGTGKTDLSLFFAKKCIMELRTSIKYINVPFIIHSLRHERREVQPNASVLLLDDLGAHVISNWTLEVLYNIIDYRLTRNLATMITSNVSPYELDQHIMSHMTGDVSKSLCQALTDRVLLLTNPIEVTGASLRLKKVLGER